MTREEQIELMASRYCKDEYTHLGFVAGAEWADENPSDDTIMQIVEAYKLWVQEFYTMPLTEFVVKWLKREQ